MSYTPMPTELGRDVGRIIRKARLEVAMSLEDVAEAIGGKRHHSGNLSNVEQGKCGVSLGLLQKIADATDQTLTITVRPAARREINRNYAME